MTIPEEQKVSDEDRRNRIFHIVMRILDGTIRDANIFKSALLVNGFDEKDFFALLHKDTAESAIVYAQAVDYLVCRFESLEIQAQLGDSVPTCPIHRQEFLLSSDGRGIALCPSCKGLKAGAPGGEAISDEVR
jgi:hypothetical protein